MKKRIFALATALVMTLSMGMTAFAAESPIVDDTPDEETEKLFAQSATACINGQVVELDFTWHYVNMRAEATEAQREQLDYYMPRDVVNGDNEEEIREMNEKIATRTRELFEKVMGYKDENVVRSDYFGLDLPSGYSMPSEGVEVTINAPYAGKGDYTYYVFHCKDDGTWEYIPTIEGNGTLTGRFTSFSPVFILRTPKGDTTSIPSTDTAKQTVQTSATTTQNAASTTKAPKTGEFAGIYVAGMMAFLSMAGIVVYVKRNKVSR